MIKGIIQIHNAKRWIKLILLFFLTSLLALNNTAPMQPDFMNDAITVDREDHYFRERSMPEGRGRAEDSNKSIDVGKALGAIVAVDAGHGGMDCGASHKDVEEKTVSLDISLKLGDMLKKSGIGVVYTREKDEYIGLNKRAKIANDAGADLFISIHCNSMEDDTSCNGSETLYKSKITETGKIDSKRFAEIVQSEMPGAIDTRDNGIKLRKRLAVLVLARMPAVIAEVGYISNDSDREKLTLDNYRTKAAEALFRAVVKTLNEIKQ